MREALLVLAMIGMTALPLTASPSSSAPQLDEREQPEGFVLSAAYPNPFNPATTFSLTVKERQEVVVEVFNILGIRVSVLFEGVMESAETRSFTFDVGDLPSGIYLYRARGMNVTATRQMTVMK